ncbi:hypothetical protein GQ457_05G000700 [Hibiscus cannabinus]
MDEGVYKNERRRTKEDVRNQSSNTKYRYKCKKNVVPEVVVQDVGASLVDTRPLVEAPVDTSSLVDVNASVVGGHLAPGLMQAQETRDLNSIANSVDNFTVANNSINADLGVGSVGDKVVNFSDRGDLIVLSSNKFDALCADVEGRIPEEASRPERAAAVGVADLMEKLRPKERKKVKGRGRGAGKDKGSKDETRVQASNAGPIVHDKFGGWSFLNNYPAAPNGRIWVFIRGAWQLKEIVHNTSQVITCCLQRGDDCFFCSFVYACNGREDRLVLWRDLVAAKAKIGLSPWVLAGDFNVISRPQESSDFNGSQGITGAMHDFLSCQADLDVTEHPYLGSFFTWCNRREDDILSRKLDRVLVNQSWFCSFPKASVSFLGPDCSDHCPSHLVLRSLTHCPPKPFKFFGFWADHPGFLRVVEDSWGLPVSGNPLQALFAKLKRLKGPLRQFNRENFSGISQRVLEMRLELENLQNLLMSKPTVDCVVREKELRRELSVLEKAEEKFYRQKSRSQSIKEGDQNSAYFFRKVAVRQKKNNVHCLLNSHGQKLESYEDISSELIDYFSGTLGVKDANVQGVPDSLLKEILGCELEDEVREAMLAPVTREDVRVVMFGMNGNKAPGPDGFSAKFFQVAWKIVGADVTQAVLYFFSSCSLPAAFNSTILTLVPKVEVPAHATDFRPIACCSTIYKCITKILTNRLKSCLPSVILPNQSAFLQGRDLVENVLLAQEIINDCSDTDVANDLVNKHFRSLKRKNFRKRNVEDHHHQMNNDTIQPQHISGWPGFGSSNILGNHRIV